MSTDRPQTGAEAAWQVINGHPIAYRAHRYECTICGARMMSMMQFQSRECPGPRTPTPQPAHLDRRDIYEHGSPELEALLAAAQAAGEQRIRVAVEDILTRREAEYGPLLSAHEVRAALAGETPTEPTCDHDGLEHGPFSYIGICPECRRCKFIGHGPLCWDCYSNPHRSKETE